MPKRMHAAAPARVSQVRMTGGFWGKIQRTVLDKALPYQWEAINDRVEGAYPSGSYRNFCIAAGLETGEHFGRVNQDSDLAKWIEAASYALMIEPNEKLSSLLEEIISVVAKAQRPDGFLHTYFTIAAPDRRWADGRPFDEMYGTGHLIEAAVAHYQATGKTSLLAIATRMARLVVERVGPFAGQSHVPGEHEEMELALMRLYEETGEKAFLSLAKYLIDVRGTDPDQFPARREFIDEATLFSKITGVSNLQAHAPVRAQRDAVGHAVRAMYLCCGMADVARETGDEALLDSCRSLFDSAVGRRMYITGGLGSTRVGEAFTGDYDMPAATAYTETCASLGLVMFASRMLRVEQNGWYADAMEAALYNTGLACMSLDGERYFYVNPVEMNPVIQRLSPDRAHVLPARSKWFQVPCCPPNFARVAASLPAYMYGTLDSTIFVHLYAQSDAALDVGSRTVMLSQRTEYPYEGTVTLRVGAGRYTLCLRVPGWCGGYTLRVAGAPHTAPMRDGYLYVTRDWADGDEVRLTMEMPPRRVYANPNVADAVGKVAVMRGPLVYCLEGVDNLPGLHRVLLPRDNEITVQSRPDMLGGVTVLQADGLYIPETDAPLYSETPPDAREATRLTFVPYYAWANRGETEMTVWVREGSR